MRQPRIRAAVERAAAVRTTPATEEQLAEATSLVVAWTLSAVRHGVGFADLNAVADLPGAAVDVIKARDRVRAT